MLYNITALKLKFQQQLSKMSCVTCDFQQCGILKNGDSDELVQSLLSLETPNDVQSEA